MSSTMSFTMEQQKKLDWLLEGFCGRVPGAEGAVLLSSDGLGKAWHAMSKDDADTLAAVVSGIYSLAKGVGKLQGKPGAGVRQVVTELSSGFLFVMGAGQGSSLGVLCSPEADYGVVGYEMNQLVESVAEHLATAVRTSEASDDGAGL